MSVVATPTPAPPPQEPAPTPEFRSQLARTMAAATEADAATADARVLGGAAYGAVGRYQAHREQVQMAEQEKRQADEEQNRVRMEAIRSDFAPRIEDLGADVKQAAAFRSGIQNRPYYEVVEEERLNEGSRRADSFGQAMDKLSPDQQGAFRTMAAGLEREDLRPADYEQVLGAVRAGEVKLWFNRMELRGAPPGVGDITKDMVDRANRVYRATEDEELISVEPSGGIRRPPGVLPSAAVALEEAGRVYEAGERFAGEPTAGALRLGAEQVRPVGVGLPGVAAGRPVGGEATQRFAEDPSYETLRELGREVPLAPEVLNPFNFVPLPIIDPLVAGALGWVFRTGARVARPILQKLTGEALELAAREGTEQGTKLAAEQFADDAARTLADPAFARGSPLEPEAVRRPVAEAVEPVIPARVEPIARVEPAPRAAREPIRVGRANTEIQRGVTDIQAAARTAPDVSVGRLTRIDWSRRRATLIDPQGQSVERRLDDLEFFREAAAPVDAPPVRPVEAAPARVAAPVGEAAPPTTRFSTRLVDEQQGRFMDDMLDETGAKIGDLEYRVDPRFPDRLHVVNFRVDEAFRGRGLGNRLLDRAVERADELGATRLTADAVSPEGERGLRSLLRRAPGTVEEGVPPAPPKFEFDLTALREPPMAPRAAPVEAAVPTPRKPGAPDAIDEAVARGVAPSEAFPTTEVKPFRTRVQRTNNAVNRAEKAHADAPRGQRAARLADVTEAKKAHREALADLKRVQAGNKKALNQRARLASRVERARGTAVERRAAAEATRTGRAAQRAASAETFAELMDTQGPLVERMRSVVMKLARMQAGRALEITAGRRGQAARLSRAIMAGRRKGLTGAEALRFERTALRGKLPKGEFQLPDEVFSDVERETLIRAAQDALRNEGLVFEAGNIRAILTDKLFPGKLLDITPGEISLLDRVFGGDFALNLSALIGMRKPSIVDQLVSIVHFPRNVLAGLFDQSGLLRQGGFMAITQNRAWRANATRYYRAFFSEDFAQARATQLMKDPNFAYLDEIGVYMPLPGRMAAGEEVLLGRDEATFLGRVLNHGAETMMEKAGVPLTLRKVLGRQLGSRAATDGMITFLSGLRRDTSVDMLVQLLSREDRLAYSMADAAGRVGILREGVEAADAKAIASFVNSATGRGTLGPLNPITRVLNLPFFAPRFVAGQITRFGPAFDPSISLTARKLILRELGKYYGTMTTVLALVGLAGWKIEQETGMVPIRVEWDPRSTDWGKIKAGPLRVDITSGALPLFRTAVQIATGQRKTALGDIQDIEVGTAALNLIRSKLSPAAGVVWSATTGKTFIGEDLSPGQIAHDVLMPIVFQDIEEAVREGGVWHVLPSLLSFTGIGIVSYTSPSVRTKEMIHEGFMTGMFNPADYDDLPDGIGDLLPEDRAKLEDLNPELFRELMEATGETVAGISERGQRAFIGELGRVGREQAVEGITQAADVFRRTENGKGFRDAVDSAFLRLRGLRSVLEEEREQLGLETRERAGPVWDDLNTFFDIFDRYPEADSDPREREDMFEEIERFYAEVGTDRADAIERQLGLPFKEVPVYTDLRRDKKTLREAGYWDIGERAWEMIVAETREGRVRVGALPLPATRREYEEQLVVQARGLPPYERDFIVDQDPDLKEYRRVKALLNQDWYAAHIDLLPVLDRWGYRELAASDVGLTEPTFRIR